MTHALKTIIQFRSLRNKSATYDVEIVKTIRIDK